MTLFTSRIAEVALILEPIKLVVFDMAGTLIEDHGEVLGAFRLALEQNGIRFADDELKSCWSRMFDANVSSSDVRAGRPAPFMIFRAMEVAGVDDLRKVVNAGDTPLDLQAGTHAGVRGVVGVLTGTYNRESLQGEPHTHIIPSVADLPALIESGF